MKIRGGVANEEKSVGFCISVILGVVFCGCLGKGANVGGADSDISSNQDAEIPVFSGKYIAGVDFGGIPFWYDDVYDTVSATLIFTRDKTVEVYMGQKNSSHSVRLFS